MRVILKDFFSTNTISLDVQASAPGAPNANEACGLFSRLGADLLGLFVLNDVLLLALNDGTYTIDADNVVSSYADVGGEVTLELTMGHEHHVMKYSRDRRPVATQFHSEDDEDADFGLWLHRILSSEERKRIFVRAWSQSDDR